jgi:hypothetical protein
MFAAFTYDYAKKFDTHVDGLRAKVSKPQITYSPNRDGSLRFRSRVYDADGKPSAWSTAATLAATLGVSSSWQAFFCRRLTVYRPLP